VLTVGKVGPANAGYYQSAVVAGMEDYYAGEGEAPGRWIGRADLVGDVAGSPATAVDAGLLLEALRPRRLERRGGGRGGAHGRDRAGSRVGVSGSRTPEPDRMLAAAVDAWQTAGIAVFGVGPSATAAQQLETGAGTEADTLHKLVHDHTNNRPPGA